VGVNDERVRPRMRCWYSGRECRRRGHGLDTSVYLCGWHWDVNRRDETASFFLHGAVFSGNGEGERIGVL
jgi:hypothetical protein